MASRRDKIGDLSCYSRLSLLMSAIRDRMMAVEFSLAAPWRCFRATWLASLSDAPAHPICFRAIDGYVPVFNDAEEGEKENYG